MLLHTNELPEPKAVVPDIQTQLDVAVLQIEPGAEQTQAAEVIFHCMPGGQKVILPVDTRLPDDVTPLVAVKV